MTKSKPDPDSDEYYSSLEKRLNSEYNYENPRDKLQKEESMSWWKPITSNDDVKNNPHLARTDRPNGASEIEKVRQKIEKSENYKPVTKEEIDQVFAAVDEYVEGHSSVDSSYIDNGYSEDLQDMINFGI